MTSTSHTSTTAFNPIPLGQLLVEENLISPRRLQQALDIQRETGDRLGQIVVAQGYVTAFQLHSAIARHYHLPFVNLHKTPADKRLQRSEDVQDYLRFQAIPFKREGDVTVIATPDPRPSLISWAEKRYRGQYAFVITSPFDIYWHLDTHFSKQLDHHSRLNLWQHMPEKSARMVLSNRQKWQVTAFFTILAVVWVAAPHAATIALLIAINLFYFVTLLLKCLLFYHGRNYRPGKILPKEKVNTLKDRDLPIYTILIPLHDEAETMPRLIKAISALDYPKSKLDIKLIVERDDAKTIKAIKSLKPHSGFEIIYVPYSIPQTKPKACNYALHFARGDYVCIYDAEDEPDPLQLKKAVYMFRHAPESVICLQARLNYYNRNHSLLTRLFAIEYAAWFDFMLPGLRKLNIPIPLGGTSNHLSLQRLRDVGEWDPYNVTEDADLGIRLALEGYETDMLDSLTAEEAPIRLNAWMAQRTRWVRGYMQTWLVHMRRPVKLYRQLTPAAFWGFQFFVGGPCLVFLSAPLLWGISALWAAGALVIDHSATADFITALALFNLAFGLISHLVYALVIVRRYEWKGMPKALATFPVYWLLHSLASFRAIWQLVVNPHLWEKTPHGLSFVDEDEKQAALQRMR